ncbi:hypothetical protein N7G274_000108 [Stereocaulon virgatum]|uniref:Uncharacterized protein n=1 Tax=Stereocaulon virgatum TaxID=373712 RepID=A0ABR4ATM8_9LECA
MNCTRRGGIVSRVGYLDRKKLDDAPEILPTLIDRRIILRGINAGSKTDMDDLSTALTAMKIKFDDIIDSTWAFDDIIDSTWAFDNADEALQYLWEGCNSDLGKVLKSGKGGSNCTQRFQPSSRPYYAAYNATSIIARDILIDSKCL